MNRRGFLTGLLAGACVAVSAPLMAQRQSLLEGRYGRYEGVSFVETPKWDDSSLNKPDQLYRGEGGDWVVFDEATPEIKPETYEVQYNFIAPSQEIADEIQRATGVTPEVMDRLPDSSIHKAWRDLEVRAQEALNKQWREYVERVPNLFEQYATHGRATIKATRR